MGMTEPDPHLPLPPSSVHVRCAVGKQAPVAHRNQMTWTQPPQRVFNIDIETCPACRGAVRIIACIEDLEVIEKILTQLDAKRAAAEAARRRPCRAAPRTPTFD